MFHPSLSGMSLVVWITQGLASKGPIHGLGMGVLEALPNDYHQEL